MNKTLLGLELLLLGEFPNGNRPRHMNVQTANKSQLRNYETLINSLQKLNGDTFLFLSQQQHGGLVGKRVASKRNAGGRLLQSYNVVSFTTTLTQPFQKILVEKRANAKKDVCQRLSDLQEAK